ncbi:conserved protein, unknown function, partial [Hepatocystis sp. ex Piliocolobus tephrosceles]
IEILIALKRTSIRNENILKAFSENIIPNLFTTKKNTSTLEVEERERERELGHEQERELGHEREINFFNCIFSLDYVKEADFIFNKFLITQTDLKEKMSKYYKNKSLYNNTYYMNDKKHVSILHYHFIHLPDEAVFISSISTYLLNVIYYFSNNAIIIYDHKIILTKIKKFIKMLLQIYDTKSHTNTSNELIIDILNIRNIYIIFLFLCSNKSVINLYLLPTETLNLFYKNFILSNSVPYNIITTPTTKTISSYIHKHISEHICTFLKTHAYDYVIYNEKQINLFNVDILLLNLGIP